MASTIKVNTIQDAGGNSLLVSDGSGSITTNNINVKDISWQSVVSTDTTMVAGRGYFVDSSGGAKTMTLPASPSVGDTVAVHALDGASNTVTIDRNSSNIQGNAANLLVDSNYGAVTLVYSDASNGWVKHNNEIEDSYIDATGGTETTSGNYKIHTFNSSSNFVVNGVSNISGNSEVSYLVVAGGAGGASGYGGGGGGAGGFREGRAANDSYTVSPLNAPAGITVTAQTYPITVGAGGAGGTNPGSSLLSSAPGSQSIFSTITSAGGGGAGYTNCCSAGPQAGGSGGGATANASSPAGAGNTPPVSPPQGNNGGTVSSTGNHVGGGGGGAGAVGGTGSNSGPGKAGDGGAGVTTHITGSPVVRAGGGGGGREQPCAPLQGDGGSGIGGDAGVGPNSGGAGTANTGSGGGTSGGPSTPFGSGGAGGSGVVIIRYKYQN